MDKNRIQQNLLPFIELLKQNGAPYFYFAGGCLRDILLGKKPNDYDLGLFSILSGVSIIKGIQKFTNI